MTFGSYLKNELEVTLNFQLKQIQTPAVLTWGSLPLDQRGPRVGLGCRLGRNRDRLPSPAPLHTKSKLRGLLSPLGCHVTLLSLTPYCLCLHAQLLSSLFIPLQSWWSPGHSSDLPGTCLPHGLCNDLIPLSSLDTCMVMPLASSALCPKEPSPDHYTQNTPLPWLPLCHSLLYFLHGTCHLLSHSAICLWILLVECLP